MAPLNIARPKVTVPPLIARRKAIATCDGKAHGRVEQPGCLLCGRTRLLVGSAEPESPHVG